MKTVAFLLRTVHCNDGVASNCESLMEGLRDAGWRVVIISGEVRNIEISAGRYEKMKALAAHWEVVDEKAFSRPALGEWLRIRKIAKKFDVSAFHCHGFSALPLGRILYFLTGVGSVATYHPSIHNADPTKMNEQREASARPTKYRALMRATMPRRILATSFELNDWLVNDVQVPAERVSHVPLGIDTYYFHTPDATERGNARKTLDVVNEECVFLLTGRLSWNKGHDLLIDAAHQLHQSLPSRKFKVIFVGSGGQENEIKARAAEVDPEGLLFKFSGYLPEARTAYWAADVFVLPSRFEGFALVVAEAMSCGLAAIRTPSGGARDQIVEGETGFVVPFDNVERLKEAMEKLLVDIPLRKRIAEQGKQRAMDLFSIKSMAEGTIKAYEQC